MSHWAQIMRERKESRLSIKAFCENAGFHENIYYYWQRKLRETTYKKIVRIEGETTNLAPVGFAEIKLREDPAPPLSAIVARQSQICVEVGRIRVTADSEYPINKLTDLLRDVIRSCCVKLENKRVFLACGKTDIVRRHAIFGMSDRLKPIKN
jgi:transposase-like protein